MTSPWLSVLTSSPGITISSRLRASSTVSRAPPKTLWSVTAIAPSPSASAWSTSACGSIEQSCDQCVCMWRSTTIQSRSPRGSPSGCVGCATGRRRLGRPARRRPRAASRAASKSLLRRGRAGLLARLDAERLVLDEPRRPRPPPARAARRGPPGRRSRSRSSLRLEQQPGAAAGSRHEDRRLGQRRPPRLRLHERSRSRPVAHRRRDRRAARQRAPCARARPPSPGSVGSSRSTARATALWPGASSTTISFRFAAGANASVSTPSGTVW